MKTKKRKCCPGCNSFISGGSEQMVRHMSKKLKCSKHLKHCIGCNKVCADTVHLLNHQKQQQLKNPHTKCIHGLQKLDYVQTLTLQTSEFSKKPISKNSNSVFSIEQPQKLVVEQPNQHISQLKCIQVDTINSSKPKLSSSNFLGSINKLSNSRTNNESVNNNDNIIGVTTNGDTYQS